MSTKDENDFYWLGVIQGFALCLVICVVFLNYFASDIVRIQKHHGVVEYQKQLVEQGKAKFIKNTIGEEVFVLNCED